MNKSKKVAAIGLFTALVVVLQLLSYFVKIGTFSLSFVLVPIVIGAVLYGPATGAWLGAAFGVVVTLTSAYGLDAGGLVVFTANPVMCTVVCLLKGALAGVAAGLIGKALKNKNIYLACVVAAVAAPVVNTGVFICGMLLFFRDVLNSWAGGTDVLFFVITAIVGINFLIELAVNAVLAPSIVRVVKAVRKA